MKKVFWILLFAGYSMSTAAQVQEAMQLALNIQKLDQLRQILQNMYDGYKILTDGYNKVKDITEGNFKLHELFLDGLMAVNPNVRNYGKVASIIGMEQQIVKEYKSAIEQFRSSKLYTIEEIEYLGNVYENLIDKTLHNLDALLMIISERRLRMNDGERIGIIDKIYEEVVDQLDFLRSFNNQALVVGIQRAKEAKDVNSLKMLYNVAR